MHPLHHLLALFPLAAAHGISHQTPADPPLTWAETHLRSEHHIYNYDAGAFFALHDFDNSNTLTRDELLRTYQAPPSRADEIWIKLSDEILGKGYADREMITRDEWMRWSNRGGVLPDLGTGVGHHGDGEYEYEIHHFEEFHREGVPGADTVHPEDEAHFKQHDLDDAEAAKQKIIDNMAVYPANIPNMFRVQGKNY